MIIILWVLMGTAWGFHGNWNWNVSDDVPSLYGEFPRPRNGINQREYDSACANGQASDQYGFACPHMMMLTDDMLSAARTDGLGDDFLYGVAGSASDDECGKCYQVRLLDAERQWRPDFKQLILQVINSGYDVMTGQFDIFMGAGGFGYFTSCNSDCTTQFCQGGPCRDSMYDTSFAQWNDAQYNDPNICYSGGIKWLDHKNQSSLVTLCQSLVGFSDLPKDQMTIDSCYRTNVELYHQNFVSLDAKRVACPNFLYRLTGLNRKDNDHYPAISISNSLDIQCRGDRSHGRYCATTMQDCCKPSCAWSNKGYPDEIYPRADTCDKHGAIYDY